MVGRAPQWDARRVRTPVPKAPPGYMLMPYAPGILLYVYGSGSTTMWAIDAGNGQIVHEGQPGVSGTAASSLSAPSFSPIDGTMTVAAETETTNPFKSLGLAGRGGDPVLGFPYEFASGGGGIQGLIDSCNSPNGSATYTLGATTAAPVSIVLAAKSTASAQSITFGNGGDNIGVDCDRAGNVYCFHSAPPTTGHYLERRDLSIVTWFATPPAGNGFGTKCIAVGTPELSGSTWFQSVYITGSTFTTKYDCRTGTQLATVATQYQNLYAASDGLFALNGATIQKLALDSLSVIWTHTPTNDDSPSLALNRNFAVDCCGGCFYTMGPTSVGAFELHKLNPDGSLAWIQTYFLPWAGAWLIPDCGKIGGYSWPSEPWAQAGSPPISF